MDFFYCIKYCCASLFEKMFKRKRTRHSNTIIENADDEFTVVKTEDLRQKRTKVDTKTEPLIKVPKENVVNKEAEPNEDDYGWEEHELVASLENISPQKAKTIINLFKEDNTVPFLCRYRRHLIGWDTTPEKLQSIKSACKEVAEIKAKAQTVIKTLEKKGQLTKDIKDEILKAKTLETINHLYDPFKERKTTLYQRAVELGLLIPSERFLTNKVAVTEFKRYINEDVEGINSFEKVKEGIKNIISYKISKNVVVLEEMEKL